MEKPVRVKQQVLRQLETLKSKQQRDIAEVRTRYRKAKTYADNLSKEIEAMMKEAEWLAMQILLVSEEDRKEQEEKGRVMDMEVPVGTDDDDTVSLGMGSKYPKAYFDNATGITKFKKPLKPYQEGE